MAVSVDLEQKQTAPVEIDGLGSFSVTLRRPTWQEKLVDENLSTVAFRGTVEDAYGKQIAHRFSTVVIGWSGVTDKNDDPIPFSFEKLTQLCASYPPIFNRIEELATRQFQLMTDAERKNDDSPSSDTSAIAATATPSENSPQS